MNIKEKFKETKKRYRKKTKVQSLAFKNEAIVLGADFWKHLMFQKNRRLRSDKDINSRLNAIDKMLEIIERTPYYQDYYVGKDKNNIIYFWILLATIDEIRYGIIVRKKGKQGNKHIYSIIPNWHGFIPRDEMNNHKIRIS